MNDQAIVYEGTKRLTAQTMSRGEYNAYRGWENPANENPSDAGYLVEYQDGGKANDSRHAGYISWSPKDVFERSYKPVSAVEPKAAPESNYGTAPRVTPADIEAEIASEHYFTARNGVFGAGEPGSLTHSEIPALGLLTFCVLVLKNGFTVTGESACASPENFNAEIGRKVARENAINKMWPLLGYQLKTELARPVLTEADAAADLAGTPRPDSQTASGN